MNPKLPASLMIVCSFIFLLTECKKDDPQPPPAPEITGFSPTSGIEGTVVTITGANFSTIAADNTVKFNGTAAIVSAATTTQLTVAVPAGAATGKITVTTAGLTATSAADFTTLFSPTVASFTPASGPVGANVAITGTNFSPTTAQNVVKFNGTSTTVTAATATQLNVTVPVDATSGKITVAVNGLTATSANDFTVIPPPTITSFDPLSGAVGATVTITGTNFSATGAENAVKFNNVTATVTAATTSQLTVTVPAGATTGNITVTVNGLTATSANDFTVIPPPTITAFAPLFGAAGSTVTISGTNFNIEPNQNTVQFNGLAASVTAATTTQLTVTVPAAAITGKITVVVNGLSVISASDFIVAPVIDSFTPASGTPGTVVTITGLNFKVTPVDNEVNFNGAAALVSAATLTQLTVTVPSGATAGKVTVTVNAMTATSANDFVVTNIWITKADFAGTGRSNTTSFVIGNKAYVGVGQNAGNGNLKEFWEYDPQTGAWTQKADFPGIARNGAAGFAIGNKGYMGTGFATGTSLKDMWEYNPSGNSWVQKNDFEGDERSGASTFVINGKAYLAFGIGTGAAYKKDLWEYEPVGDDWVQKMDFPGTARAFGAAMTIGGKGYAGFGQSNSGSHRDFYEYDPVANNWFAKADFPLAESPSTQAFSIGSKGYSGATNLWLFDPVPNSWTQKAALPETTYSGVGFSIGNYGYIGVGYSAKFFQYVPEE